MGNAALTLTKEAIEISGRIGFDNVVSVCQQGITMFKHLNPIIVDLKNLSQSNSSGLALFSEWVRAARKVNQTIQFRNVPPFMQDIFKVCGLEGVFPIL